MPLRFYVIELNDPLVIGAGRPFNAIEDSVVRFPTPATVAGALRNAYAKAQGLRFDDALLDRPVWGPLAVRYELATSTKSDVTKYQLLVPKPDDAHYIRCEHEQSQQGSIKLCRAHPRRLLDQEGCDLPVGLWPMMFATEVQGKPASGPQWWSAEHLMQWRQGKDVSFEQIQTDGWQFPELDIRTHIARESKAGGSLPGYLFQTTGLPFWHQQDPSKLPTYRIGLLAGLDTLDSPAFEALNLGGERRLARVREIAPEVIQALTPKEKHGPKHMNKPRLFSLTFLTPALFTHGWLPGWLDKQTLNGTLPGTKVSVKLQAVALTRGAQPMSGWNLQTQLSRPTRKQVPAGTTYWFAINEQLTDPPIRFLSSYCDRPEDNNNGFGLALWLPECSITDRDSRSE